MQSPYNPGRAEFILWNIRYRVSYLLFISTSDIYLMKTDWRLHSLYINFLLPQSKEMPGGPETVDFWVLHIWHPKAYHNVFRLWLSLKKDINKINTCRAGFILGNINKYIDILSYLFNGIPFLVRWHLCTETGPGSSTSLISIVRKYWINKSVHMGYSGFWEDNTQIDDNACHTQNAI